jgi:hypothetical protein
MERAMKHAFMAGAWVTLFSLIVVGDASAAVWQWGCMGPNGDTQIIFNRGTLIVLPAGPSRGKLRHLIALDDLTKISDDAEAYNSDDDNSGFQRKMEFTRNDNPKRKLTLTEKSSNRISRQSHLVCGRDEITDIYRKVYRFKRDDARPRDITMQCMEYQLTTTGGRPCTFD